MKLIENNSLTVLLRYNLHEFILVANYDRLLVLDAHTNNLIDTLSGHLSQITAIDSSLDGIIVSISKVEVCFYVPTSALKWSLCFKSQMQGDLVPVSVKISSIGDICVLAGDQFVSLWTQDISHDWNQTSYTQQVFYSANSSLHASQMGQVLETNPSLAGIVRQIDITGDGRMFFTLEDKSRHVKIWSQTSLREQSNSAVRMFLFQDLSCSQTKESMGGYLQAFRMKFKSPNSLAIEPAIILTLSQFQVCIHVESLMDTEMRFICLQTIKVNSRIESFDAHFVVMEEQFPVHLSSNPVQSHHLSKIFDTHRDEELKLKKRQLNNKYGIIQTYCERPAGMIQGLSDQKFDYFLVSECQQTKINLTLYRCKGMSNVPMRTPVIEPFKKLQTTLDIPFNNIIWASCYPNLLRSTPQHDLIRLIVSNSRGNIFNADFDVKQTSLTFTSSYALHSNTKKIQLSTAHPDLRLLALVFEDEIVLYSGDQLYGTHKTTGVKSLQWFPNKNQFLLLRQTSDGVYVELVTSSQSVLKTVTKAEVNLDQYIEQTKLSVSEMAIGIVISGFSESDRVKLHFCVLISDGSTAVHCFEYDPKQFNGKVEHVQISQNQAYQDGHLVLDLIAQNFANNKGYFLAQSESQVKSRTGKSVNYIRFNCLDSETDCFQEVFKLEIEVNHKVQARMQHQILLVSIVEGDYSAHKHVLYIYNFELNQYLGFIRLSEILSLQIFQGRKVCTVDYSINQTADQITVIAGAKVFLLSKQLGKWALTQQACVLSFVPESVSILDEFIIVEQNYVVRLPELQSSITSSLPIYHPSLLKILFFKGYPKQVAQIIAELYLNLQDIKSPLPDISRIKFVEEAKAAQKKPFNIFGDLDESESDSENINEEKNKQEVDPVILFGQKSDDIITAIIDSEDSLAFTAQEKLDLIEFIYKFRAIYQMDFYADKLSVQLLNQVYFETEKTSASDMAYSKSLLGLSGENAMRDQPAAKPFSMEELINQRMLGAHKSQADVSGIQDWSSKMVNLALHSENQDVILDQLSQRLDFPTNLTWVLMRRLGIPLWLKSDFKLKQMIEMVAKNEYRLYESEGNQLSQTKTEYAALWYVLTGKVSVLRQLFNVELGGKKFAEFLESDFNQAKPKTIAGKNALALVAKRKNLLACSFFLLAQDLPGAVQVALERCQDPLLGVIMCRVQDPNNEQKQIDVIAEKYFIERGKLFNDPYLKSIGQWLKREYVKSVNELEPTVISQIEHMFQPVPEFDLSLSPQKESKKPNQTSLNEVVVYPLVAKVGYESLDLLVRLKKVPEVKRLLNKDWQVDTKAKAKKGGSIFDDFLGSGSSSEEEIQQKETITVNEDLLFETLLIKLLELGFNQIALLLIQERVDLNTKLSSALKQKIAGSIIIDTCSHKRVETHQIQTCLAQLKEQLKVEVDKVTVTKCLSQMDMFSVEINFLLENSNGSFIEIFDRVDKQAGTIIQFMRQSALYSGQLYTSKIDIADQRSKDLLRVVKTIEEILDALILYDNQPTVQQKLEPQKPKSPLISQSYDDNSDEDIQGEAVPNAPLTNKMTNSSKLLGSDGGRVSIIELLGTLSFKCRIGVTLSAAVFQLCIATAKISLIAVVQAQLISFLSVWNWSSATITEALIKQNLEKLSFQSLKTLVQRVKISISKQVERSTSKIERKEAKSVYYFVQDWLRFIACFGTMDQVLANALRILGNNKQPFQQPLVQVQSRVDNISESRLEFTPPELIQILDWQNRLFDQRSQIQFEYSLSLKQKRLFLQALNQFTSVKSVDTNQKLLFDLSLIIKSQTKFKEYAKTFNLQKQQAILEDLCISCRSNVTSQPNEQEVDTLKNGIELFKQKGENISDFQIRGDTLVIAMQSKGMREIMIGSSLLYRNRSNVMDLLDEELFSWYDCLHRFDNYQQMQVEPKLEAVRQAVLVHQNKKSLLNTVKQRQNQIILQKDIQVTEFDGIPVQDYLRQQSSLEITHEDYTNAVAVHQKVPIYLTGNAKGIVCLWQIGQTTDRSLNQWICEPEIRPQDANPKKSTIRKIEFTPQGDKFVVLNMEGSLFIFSFEPGNKNLALASKKGLKLSDFHILDCEGSTVLAISQQNKMLMIIDLMTGLILSQAKVSGTDMQFDPVRQHIYTFNQKSGFIHRHDISMQEKFSKQIGKEDITSSLQFGHFGKYLAVGFSDGTLKIFSLEEGDFDQPRHQMNVFTSVNGKRGPVSSLKYSTESGALYASSTLGCVKLVKVIV